MAEEFTTLTRQLSRSMREIRDGMPEVMQAISTLAAGATRAGRAWTRKRKS